MPAYSGFFQRSDGKPGARTACHRHAAYPNPAGAQWPETPELQEGFKACVLLQDIPEKEPVGCSGGKHEPWPRMGLVSGHGVARSRLICEFWQFGCCFEADCDCDFGHFSNQPLLTSRQVGRSTVQLPVPLPSRPLVRAHVSQTKPKLCISRLRRGLASKLRATSVVGVAEAVSVSDAEV